MRSIAPARHADALGRRADAAGIEHAVEHFAPAVDLADHRVAVELDPVEGQVAGHRAVDQPDRVVAEARGVAAAPRTASRPRRRHRRPKCARKRQSCRRSRRGPRSPSCRSGGSRCPTSRRGWRSVRGGAWRLRRSRPRTRCRPRSGPAASGPCASSPACASALAAMTELVRNGDGVRLRPISSSTMPASTWPMPSPPSASGTSRPVKPISAIASTGRGRSRPCTRGRASGAAALRSRLPRP